MNNSVCLIMCLEIIQWLTVFNVQKIATVLLVSKILDNPGQLLHKYMIINKRHVNAEMSSEVEAIFRFQFKLDLYKNKMRRGYIQWLIPLNTKLHTPLYIHSGPECGYLR